MILAVVMVEMCTICTNNTRIYIKKYMKYKLSCQNNQKFCKNILFIKELKFI